MDDIVSVCAVCVCLIERLRLEVYDLEVHDVDGQVTHVVQVHKVKEPEACALDCITA